MKPLVVMLVVALLLMMTAAWIVFAQMPLPPISTPNPSLVGSQPAEKGAQEVEGTVKKVDLAASTVQVSSGPVDLFGAKLEVGADTHIEVNGQGATIAEIREGARVRAAYEADEHKNVAKSIQVRPNEKRRPTGSPSAAPGTPH